MKVSCTTNDPHEAAVLTNAVVNAYMSNIVNAEQTRRRQRLGELERVAGEKKIELRKQRDTLKRLTSKPSADNAKAAPPKPIPRRSSCCGRRSKALSNRIARSATSVRR